MSKTADALTDRYDTAAPLWGDKMRKLGYFDGYCAFLDRLAVPSPAQADVIDIGAGTAAFAEAWVTTVGAPRTMTLLEPSAAMMSRGARALNAHGIVPQTAEGLLGHVTPPPADYALAAHVIEHCPDPLQALRHMHALLRPGGTLFLVVSKPHWCNAIIWFQWRHRTFGEAEICDLVRLAGFDIDSLFAFPSGPPSRTSRGVVARRV